MTPYELAQKFLARQAAERKAFANDLKDARIRCTHERVLHWTGDSPGGTLFHPIRLCLVCGLEEEGSWWSYAGRDTWSVRDYSYPPRLANRDGRQLEATRDLEAFNKRRLVL